MRDGAGGAESAAQRRLGGSDRAGVGPVLRILSRIAAPHGVRLAYEFLGFADCTVNTLAQCAAIVEKVARPNVGLVLDTFHFFAGGSTLASIREVDPGRIFIVHINDVERAPRRKMHDALRLYPGKGILPLQGVLRGLKAIGYTGPVSVRSSGPSTGPGPRSASHERRAPPVWRCCGTPDWCNLAGSLGPVRHPPRRGVSQHSRVTPTAMPKVWMSGPRFVSIEVEHLYQDTGHATCGGQRLREEGEGGRMRMLGLLLVAGVLSSCASSPADPSLDAAAKLFRAPADKACI